MSAGTARVSVVVPTFERPGLVVQASRSALAQTHPPLEVLVVVDGETPEATTAALAVIGDARLRVLTPGRRLGNARARNLGVQHARGEWIALLDDDDRWATDKLARQLGLLAGRPAHPDGPGSAGGPVPILSCRLEARAGARRFLWPRLLPRANESVARYLYCRRWPLTGDRLVQTSTLVVPRELLVRVPFRTGRRFVDQDWLLRAAREARVRLLFPPERRALLVWDIAPRRPRVSHYRDWRWCVAWARRRRHLLDTRSHAAFLLTLASASAADAGETRAFWPLLREAWREGRPNPAELATHAANFVLSRPLRDAVATRVNRWLGS